MRRVIFIFYFSPDEQCGGWGGVCCQTSSFVIFSLFSRPRAGLAIVCVCMFSSHSFWTSSSLDVPAGITQEEVGHIGFLIHLLSAVRALILPKLAKGVYNPMKLAMGQLLAPRGFG